MEPKNNEESKEDISDNDIPFFDRPFEEVDNGYIDDRGFYTTPNGSFWDENHNYFNHFGLDIHGGTYDKYGVYIPGPNYDEETGLYNDQKELYNANNVIKASSNIIKKLKKQEKKDKKVIEKYEQPIDNSDSDSDDEDYIPKENEESESDDNNNEQSNSSNNESDDIKEAYHEIISQEKKESNNNVKEEEKKNINDNKPLSVIDVNDIILKEILNPEIYTGIIERDFHLYIKSTNSQKYIHIEPDTKPKCSCQIDDYSFDEDDGKTEKCKHIRYVLNHILHLDINKSDYVYSESELKNAFKKAEKNNKNLIRETYGLVVRKNFDFPNPKKYKYEYDENNDEDGYESHEWRIKERLYARGIVAEEFHFSDNDYSCTEEEYNNYFTSEKEAKPTPKCYEKPVFTGKQLKLDKKYKEEEIY
jgi:hypothetical protein